MPGTNAGRLYELSEEVERSLHRMAADSNISYIELESMYKTMLAFEQVLKPQQPKRVVRI